MNKKLLTLCLSVFVISAPWNASGLSSLRLFGLGQPSFSNISHSTANYKESLLVKSLLEVTQGKLQQALRTTNQLLAEVPNFKLAYLVRGDLLMAQAQQLQSFGNSNASSANSVNDFREEARMRLAHYLSEQSHAFIPDTLLQIDNQHAHFIVVDTNKSRLYVYQNVNGKPVYLADYYVTIGKNGAEKKVSGDKRTPVGVYMAATKLNRPLDEIYGIAAYPLNYPNNWDSHQGKNGDGIWLHGTPSNTYSRPPRSSDGCVVISNEDLKALEPILKNGNTPVIIADDLKWLESNQLATKRDELNGALESWRSDWQSQNTDAYLSHYSAKFFTSELDFKGWAIEKRRIQASKPKVSIKLTNVSLLRYPGNAQQMAVVSFDQTFNSSYINNTMRKQQYWIMENNRWKILFEGGV